MNDKNIILVVDDRPQNIELLEAYLTPQGYEIVTAAGGQEALDKLSANRIDLVLLDVMMSGMDGFEVTRRIRKFDQYRLLPIILVTALRETEDRVRGIEAGCDDFISKPVDKIELLARVSSLLKVKAYNDLLNNYRENLEYEVVMRTRELASLNKTLEKKVEERTEGLNHSLSIQNELNVKLTKITDDLEKEKQKIEKINKALSEKSIELENEKELLTERNEIMEKDLDMARSIQKCFMPDKSPVPYISYKYKPMEKVGGDFFDFIRNTDNNDIGIFISDVSGHGVPAAFITAMIKSSILQSSHFVNTPSSVLEILNDVLRDQSAGNFVTALYGIYKPETREFIYSNAGHNPPYIINESGINIFNMKSRAIPLAIIDNQESRELNKIYINERVVLEKGSKLILYTDGFTEATSFNLRDHDRNEDFESGMLNSSLRKHFDKPAELFIKGIYQDLVDFRGSEDFEDDVCIICMDVE